MTNKLFFMCLFSVITWTNALSEVKFSIVSNDTYSCIQTESQPTTVTVLENEKLEFKVVLEGQKQLYKNIFQCYLKDSNKNIFEKTKIGEAISITSTEVTASNSGIWICKIFFNKSKQESQASQLKPFEKRVENDRTVFYTVVPCYVKVHVRLKETPQKVILNNMILPTQQQPEMGEPTDHVGTYNYLDGDIVDVSCIHISNNSITNNITFRYSYASTLHDTFKKDVVSKLGSGFRITLRHEHDSSLLTCRYDSPQDYTTIKVIFVLKTPSELESKGYMEINDLKARPMFGSLTGMNIREFKITYLFFKDTDINLTCNSYENNLIATDNEDKCEPDIAHSTFTTHLKSPFKFNCIICDKKLYDLFDVQTKEKLSSYMDTKRLSVALPRSNILIDVYTLDYDTQESTMIYEFEESDTVDLKCTESHKSRALLNVILKLNKTEITEKTVTLTTDYDNAIFECQLVDQSVKKRPVDSIPPYKHIKVIFKLKKRITDKIPIIPYDYGQTTLPDRRPESQSNFTSEQHPQSDSVPVWMFVTGGLLVCIVVICVITAMYKMIKRKKKNNSGVNNYENLQSQSSEAPTLPHPKQWSRDDEQPYQVPLDIRNDSTIYVEPFRQESPYAIPIPKSQRQPKGGRVNPGLIYAELDIAPVNRSVPSNSKLEEPQYTTVKELYSEVVPKNLRKNDPNYGNVFPDSRYVNSNNTEYVEPTYCQAFIK